MEGGNGLFWQKKKIEKMIEKISDISSLIYEIILCVQKFEPAFNRNGCFGLIIVFFSRPEEEKNFLSDCLHIL